MPLDDERVIASLSLLLFALPAFVPAVTLFTTVPSYLLKALPLVPVAALLFYWLETASSGNSPRTTGTDRSEPIERMVDAPTETLELVSANYHTLNRQAMYRDRLLMRAKYFSQRDSAEAHGFSRGRKRGTSVRQSTNSSIADSPIRTKIIINASCYYDIDAVGHNSNGTGPPRRTR